jgi:hypothetical protein
VLNPPNSAGPVHAKRLDPGVPYESVRSVQPDHPVLYRVTSARVAVTQSAVLGVSDTLESLWMAGSEPVLAAGEAGGQRLVVTAFQPARSEQLALLSAFPLLIGNSLYWCAENAEALAALKAHHTGDLVNPGPGLVRWRYWDGARFADASEEVKASMLELRRIGVWEAGNGTPQASLLLSTHETDVPGRAAVTGGGVTASTRWAGGASWSALFLWLVLAVLLAESWLFHRQAVY